jgi:hypothetical protein
VKLPESKCQAAKFAAGIPVWASMSEDEKKPIIGGEEKPGVVQLVVRGADGAEIHFKVMPLCTAVLS